MRHRSRKFFLFILAGLMPGGLGVAQAQLASKSPFMPAQAAGASAPASNAPLEYRGYLEIGGMRQFRLYDPEKKVSVWVQLNERHADLNVLAKEHDADAGTLTVEHRGTVHKLAIRVGKILAGGAPPPPTVAASIPSNVAPAVVQSVVVNPTPADEQRRLESVAAEVARRRALRNQAEQTVQQAPPVPALPQSR